MATLTTLLWDVTRKCNLSCIHCFNTDKYRGVLGTKRQDLTTQQAMEAISKIADVGFQHLHLLGGEPLVRADLTAIIAQARSKGLRVTINSNGILLDERKANELIDLGVEQFTVSLDGATPEVDDLIRGMGSFARATSNLRMLVNLIYRKNSTMQTAIAFTLTKLNLHQLEQMLALCSEIGVTGIDFMELYVSGEAHKNQSLLKYSLREGIDSLERLVEKHTAHYPNLSVQFDSYTSLVFYLNRKYQADIIMNPRNMACRAADENWLMEADGLLNPCGVCNSTLYNREPLVDGRYRLEMYYVTEVPSLDIVANSTYFQSFLHFRNDPEFYAKFVTCRKCDHRAYCRPCPFIHYKDIIIPECEEVHRRIQQFENEVLALSPRLSPNTVWQESNGQVKVWDTTNKEFRELEGFGRDIWYLIKDNERATVGDLLEMAWRQAKQQYEQLPNKRQFRREFIDFVWGLKRCGWLAV